MKWIGRMKLKEILNLGKKSKTFMYVEHSLLKKK